MDKNEKECLKNAKIKGWNKELSLDLLESDGFNLSKYKEYKGLVFRGSSYYEFKEAINPLIILYRKERHSYKLEDVLREACLVQLIQIKAHENQLIFKQDIENLITKFNEINKDNISKAIYAPDLEKDLTSDVAKIVLSNIEKKKGKELVGSKDDFDNFLNELSIEKEKTPEDQEQLVKENSKKMLQQLYQSLGKKNKP